MTNKLERKRSGTVSKKSRRGKRKRKSRKSKKEKKDKSSKKSLSCCRKKRGMKKATSRKGKSKKRKRSKRSKKKSKSKKSKKLRKSRKGKRKMKKDKYKTAPEDILANREHLGRSQSLTKVEETPRERTTPTDASGKTQTTYPPRQIEFSASAGLRDDSKKRDDGISTAIDADSSFKGRRSRRASERSFKKESYTELVKDGEDKYRLAKAKPEEPALEPSIGRVSDLIPLEDGIDPHFPAQRIVISNFVRNGCYIKRWLYEDCYPLHGNRPTIGDLMSCGPRRYSKKCTCSRRSVSPTCCREDRSVKRLSCHSADNEKIQGELRQLDVLLKNFED